MAEQGRPPYEPAAMDVLNQFEWYVDVPLLLLASNIQAKKFFSTTLGPRWIRDH